MIRSTPSGTTVIVLIGNDERLVYLLQRYFEISSCKLIPLVNIPTSKEISTIKPSVIIFSNIELLEVAQSLLDHTSVHEIPIMVCTSVAGEARARELRADACLLHPLTYENFRSALAGFCPFESNLSGLQTKTSGF